MNPGRWITYQRERFPVLAHGVLIAAFSVSAVSFSFLLRGGTGLPDPVSVGVAFVSAFLFFLQLRIADEFKDYDEDARYRPYRPVPRGLVTLRELGRIAIAGAVIQLALAIWRTPPTSLFGGKPEAIAGIGPAVFGLPVLLVGIWGYLGLMTQEFFVRDWIRSRPITYLWTHMLILPFVDFYATACDWAGAGAAMPGGLFWFLLVSFWSGVVLEFGRKIRAPSDEEAGVQTYSVLWGRGPAMAAWFGAILVTGYCAWKAAARIDFAAPVAVVLCCLLLGAAMVGGRFLVRPVSRRAKWIEHWSGIWTLLMYLSLGAAPLLWRLWNPNA